MKFFYTLIFIFSLSLGNSVFSQQKYPSLLWEISGNGLKKSSYLYGTMHVSNKIAFNLGEEFFDALNTTDAVALETNPEHWLDFYKDSGLYETSQIFFNQNKSQSDEFFYHKFSYHPEYSLETYQMLFKPQDKALNQLLYRYNFGQENYEETTYLDMFIFQSAKKSSKPVHSLEDFIESFFLAERASLPDEDETKPNFNNSYNSRKDLETFYLERNLDKLDSMITKNYSKNYRKYLLDIRNEKMVESMDTLMHLKSIFAGVGAAHLAGKKGMINMLQEKGYTVQPVDYKQSSKSTKTFKKIKNAAVNVPLKKHVSDDGKIELLSSGKFHTESYGEKTLNPIQSYFCPDYANGSYYGYERLIKLDFVPQSKRNSSINHIDSILYLITPGDIQKRKNTTLSGYPAIEILSELPRGNFLQIIAVETPLELIVFKAGGNKSFIKSKNVGQFFKSIQINKKNTSLNYKDLGLEIDFPVNNVEVFKNKGDFYLSGRKNNAQYTFQGAFLTDFSELEEDEFELQHLIKSFAKEVEAEYDTLLTSSDQLKKVQSKLVLKDGTDLQIMTTSYQNFYYLLTSTASKEDALLYFNSLKIERPNHHEYTFEKQQDTIMKFVALTFHESIINESLLKEFVSLKNDYLQIESKKDSLNKDFEGEQESKVLLDPLTGEKILITMNKLNYYYSPEKGLEEIKDRLLLNESPDSLHYGAYILNSKEDKNKVVLEYKYVKKGTSKVLINKLLLYKDRYYSLTSTYDTLLGLSVFTQRFFDTFEPMDENENYHFVLDHKGHLFLKHIQSEVYQLKEQARKSVTSVNFKKEDKLELEALLLNDSLEIIADELRNHLLYSYYNTFQEDEDYLEFLKKYYNKFKENPSLQITALNRIAQCKTPESTSFYMTALEEQPPVTQSDYEIRNLFNAFTYKTELLKPILPKLQKWALENEDFFPQVVYYIDRGIYNKGFTIDDISKKYIDKIEKKGRQVIRKMNYLDDEKSLQYDNMRDHLVEISSILYSVPNSKNLYKKFFEEIDTITNKRFKAHILAKKINRGNDYSKAEIESVLRDTNYVFSFMEWIESAEDSSARDRIVKDFSVSNELIYYSYLLKRDNNFNVDSSSFYKKMEVSTYGDSGFVYIYKVLDKYDNWSLRAVYFIKENEDESLFTEPLFTMQVRVDDEKWDEKLKDLITNIENSNRPRVKEKYGGFDSYY